MFIYLSRTLGFFIFRETGLREHRLSRVDADDDEFETVQVNF